LLQAHTTPRTVRSLTVLGGRTRRGASFGAKLTASSSSTVRRKSSVSASVSAVPHCHGTVYDVLRWLKWVGTPELRTSGKCRLPLHYSFINFCRERHEMKFNEVDISEIICFALSANLKLSSSMLWFCHFCNFSVVFSTYSDPLSDAFTEPGDHVGARGPVQVRGTQRRVLSWHFSITAVSLIISYMQANNYLWPWPSSTSL